VLYYIEVFIFIARRIPLEKKYTLTKAILVLIFLLSAASVGFVAQPYTAINCILISLCLGGIGYYCTKFDIVKAAIGLLSVLLVSFYIANPGLNSLYNGFRIFVIICPASLIAGVYIKKKSDFATIYTFSVLAFVLSIMLLMLKISVIDNVNIMDVYIRQPLKLVFNANLALHDLPLPVDKALFTPEYIKAIADSIAYSMPSAIIISAMVIIYIYIYFLKKIIKLINKNEKFENMVCFSHLKIKRTTVLTLFVLYLISLFASGMFGIIAGNIISILTVMCTACGFSVIDFYFKKSIRSTVLRIIIYISLFMFLSVIFALFTFSSPIMLISLIGMIDASRDFRKIDKTNIRIIFK